MSCDRTQVLDEGVNTLDMALTLLQLGKQEDSGLAVVERRVFAFAGKGLDEKETQQEKNIALEPLVAPFVGTLARGHCDAWEQ